MVNEHILGENMFGRLHPGRDIRTWLITTVGAASQPPTAVGRVLSSLGFPGQNVGGQAFVA